MLELYKTYCHLSGLRLLINGWGLSGSGEANYTCWGCNQDAENFISLYLMCHDWLHFLKPFTNSLDNQTQMFTPNPHQWNRPWGNSVQFDPSKCFSIKYVLIISYRLVPAIQMVFFQEVSPPYFCMHFLFTLHEVYPKSSRPSRWRNIYLQQ
jgi:hypothetical protein